MNTVAVGFTWLDPQRSEGLVLPAHASELAAGVDVAACLDMPVCIEPGQIKLVGCGFALAIPAGYEIQVRPRSGLAVRHGITLINSPGTIDADYRGEIKVGLINLGSEPFTVRHGDRIAQMVLAPVVRASFTLLASLDETGRGDGGFGSTGLR
jgi:dUTP pyrophosphatase